MAAVHYTFQVNLDEKNNPFVDIDYVGDCIFEAMQTVNILYGGENLQWEVLADHLMVDNLRDRKEHYFSAYFVLPIQLTDENFEKLLAFHYEEERILGLRLTSRIYEY